MNDIIKIKTSNNKNIGVLKKEKEYFIGHRELNNEIDKIILSKSLKLLKHNKYRF